MSEKQDFSEQDIAEISEQPFTKGVGAFMPSQFKVSAGMGMENVGLHMSTAMFFESVPDEYVDVNLDNGSLMKMNGLFLSLFPVII